MNKSLMKAILAMDAYNRGYNEGIKFTEGGDVPNTQIGTATVLLQSDFEGATEGVEAGFYAIAYQYDGEVIISYRGTDELTEFNGIGGDATNGYGVGAGVHDGPQAILATEFYTEVSGETELDITLTGHSLGGGLAGFIGAVYGLEGLLFDNMAFEEAAEEANENFNISFLSTEYIDGEFLYWGRSFQSTPQYTIDIGDNVDLPSAYDGVGLHSMATLVIGKYAEVTDVGEDWDSAAQYFWPVMYDDVFAHQIGMDEISGRAQEKQDYAGIMRTLIAYSAIDEGTRVFGDTGIRAFYDDANNLGEALETEDVSTAIVTFAEDISRSFVQYAAHLAQNGILQSGSSSFAATEGVVSLSGGLLTVDFSDTKWKMGTESLPYMAAKEMFINHLDTSVSSGALRSAIWQVYGDNLAGVVEKISFAITQDGDSYTLSAPSEAKAHIFITEQVGGGVDVITGSGGNDIIMSGDGDDDIAGGDGNDILVGGDGDDILVGGADNDALIGGAGTDSLYGGDGDDIIYADAELSVAEDEIYDGGDGYDVLDFKGFETGLDCTIDGSSSTIEEYGGSFSDVRSGMSITDIEGFNLTDHKDRLEITDETTGGKVETHGGDDEIFLHGASAEVRAGTGNDEAEITGNFNTLYGGEGNDEISVSGNYNQIYSEDFADQIKITGDHNTIDTGYGEDVVKVSGVANEIFTGYDDDEISLGGSGNIVYTGEGEDEVGITNLLVTGDQALLADASVDDRVTVFGWELSGGLKNISQETPWIRSGFIRYGVNTDGDLVIGTGFFDGELYVSNYHNTLLSSTSTLGITLGEVAAGAYAIYRDVINYPYGVTLQDTIKQLPQTIKIFRQNANPQYDPLVLDLDGDGVETTANSSAAPLYDFNGDGFAERAGWVHSDDGFLVLDDNEDGRITSDEMFGSSAVSGFTALAALDGNTDGKIDVSDAAFADLKVWRDLDQDGVTDSGELFSLSELGIKSINVTPDTTVDATQAGNTITAAGTFTWDNDETGETGEVLFDSTPYYSRWLEDVTITTEAEALPELKGHGTIAGLRASMSYDEDLVDTVETVLATLNTHNLESLRTNILPLLSDWMDAIPVPGGAPGTTARADVAILATNDPLTGASIEDYGIPVTDGSGTYWVRASGDDVLDEFDDPIERPTYEDLLAQAGWTELAGEVIQFFERWTGLNIPLGVEGGETGSSAVDAVQEVFSSFWSDLNVMAVRLAVQGPLAATFEGIAYDAAKDKFVATTDGQLVPLFENIFDASADAAALAAWEPVLNVFLNDFARPGGLDISYAWLYQNVIAAYENTDPAGFTLADAADSLGVPSEQRVTSGTEDNDLFYMTSGNQTVAGGEGVDSYIFGENFGQDVVDDEDSVFGSDHTDSIRFAHLNPEDVVLYRDGNDLIIDVNDSTDEVRVTDQFLYRIPSLFGGYINSAHGVSEIIFADGTVWDRIDMSLRVSHPENTNDNIIGTGQNDYLDGGAGNDKLTGGNEGDVYVFGEGYGQDLIADATPGNIGLTNTNDTAYSLLIDTPDILYFKDVALADIEFVRIEDSRDLTIGITGTSDTVTIKDQFDASYTGIFGTQWFDRIESFVFADGESLQWDDLFSMLIAQNTTSGNDEIYGFSWEDTLDGGAGNDYLSGGNENDTYIFGRGYGDDIINDDPTDILSGQDDRLVFADDIEVEDIAIERGAGIDDIRLRIIDTNETVTLVNQAKQFASGSNFYEIEQIVFADETVWDTAYLKTAYLESAGTSGNDTIIAFTGHDTIVGGAGDDYMEGRGGGDTYIFSAGHGNDVIKDFAEYITWNQEDTIDFQGGIESDDVEFAKDGNDLIVTYTGSSDSIEIRNFFLSSYYRIENFQFSDVALTDNDVITLAFGTAPIVGTESGETLTGNAGHNVIQGLGGNDTLIGSSGDDILDGGDGNDKLEGGSDNDIYNASAGNDVIEETSGTDTILFGEGIIAEDLEITRVYETASFQHLLIEWGEGNSILVDGQYDNGIVGNRVETITFFDNSTLDLMTITPVTKGTSGNNYLIGETDTDFNNNDTIYGYGGNDTLEGRGGNDVLIGGEGNDTLEGDEGDDVYVYESGDDTVDDSGSSQGIDSIRMPDGIEPGDLTIVRLGGTNNMLIEIDGLGTITVLGQFLDQLYRRIEKITFESDPDIDLVGMQIVTRGTSGTNVMNGDGDFMSVNDIIYGYGGNDTIDGRTGADIIYGGDGNDSLIGSAGNDTIYGETGSDNISAGNDNDLVYGGDDNDSISGGSGSDTLYGESGNDTLDGGTGADTMVGGIGDDVYVVDNAGDMTTENANEGIDTVLVGNMHYTLQANVENLTLTGSASIDGTGNSLDNVITGNSGANSLAGGDGNDTLYGGSNADRLFGGNGNDILDGGTGADTMTGNSGDDIYVVDNAGDIVNESIGEGTDTVQSSITYTLGANVENLTLTGSSAINGTGNTLDNVINGNSGVNTLTGGDGNDTLDGGTDADTLIGGTGDDLYVVDNVSDVVTENATEGTDAIQSSVTYTLSANVENITLTGSSNIDVTGNTLDNMIAGNTGNNTLTGDAGSDTYIFNDGDGDDVVIDSGGTLDSIVFGASVTVGSVEYSADGDDLIISYGTGTDTITVKDFLAGSANQIEQVVFDDTTVHDVSYILGQLGGPSSGDDTLEGTAGNDSIDGLAGNDTIYGYAGADTLIGGDGNDLLDGGTDADTLIGGAGNDIYIVDNVGDVVTENASEGTDTVQSSITYTLGANVENLTLTGSSNINGTGTTLDNILIGNSGNNVLAGGEGNDTLIGGAGNDWLSGWNGIDTVVYSEAASGVVVNLTSNTATGGDGSDTLQGIENVTGSAYADTLIGTATVNTIMGLGGNDTIEGGNGADLIDGGDGSDVAVYSNNASAIVANLSTGTVTTTGGNDFLVGIEGIVGTGWVDTLIGDSGANYLFGGGSNDTLEGGGGDDTLDGGLGTEDYVIYSGASSGVVVNLPSGTATGGQGNDTLSNLEHIVGSAYGDTLIGSSVKNYIYGGDGNDVLDAAGGFSNRVYGEGGNDTIFSGGATDTFDGGSGTDLLDLAHGVSYGNVVNLVTGTLTGGAGTAVIAGFEDVSGSSFRDTITGDSGANMLSGMGENDTIDGGGGADVLKGGEGNDSLTGGDGNDFLWGGNGLDNMWGGAGADIFVFEAANAYNNIDVIKDFNTGQGDAIDINNLLSEYDPLTEALTDFVEITTSGSDSVLKVDRDGTGGTYGFVQIAKIEGVTGLTDEDALVASGNLIVS